MSDVICSVNWNENCNLSKNENALFSKAEVSLIKLANWCKQIENIYSGNIALPFIREAQLSAQDFCCLVSLGLYKTSASSLRTILESFLYFSYFKDHLVELQSLSEVDSYYISKQDVLDYHCQHTREYKEKARISGLSSRLAAIYGKISAIVHGQMPGVWHSSSCLSDKKFDAKLAEEAIFDFNDLIEIINLFMLIIISDEDWLNIDQKIKAVLLRGLTGKTKDMIQRN